MSLRDLVPWNWGESKVPARREQAGDPFATLHREMNRLFDETASSFGMMPFGQMQDSMASLMPTMDISESGKKITVTAELPGMKEEDIEVTLQHGHLTIKGEKKEEQQKDDEHRYVERRYGSFQRTIPLPDGIDEEHVEASFKDGVLTLEVPKTEKCRTDAKRIEVKNN